MHTLLNSAASSVVSEKFSTIRHGIKTGWDNSETSTRVAIIAVGCLFLLNPVLMIIGYIVAGYCYYSGRKELASNIVRCITPIAGPLYSLSTVKSEESDEKFSLKDLVAHISEEIHDMFSGEEFPASSADC